MQSAASNVADRIRGELRIDPLVTWKSSKTMTGNSSGCEDSELIIFLRKFVVNANTGTVAGEDEILAVFSHLRPEF